MSLETKYLRLRKPVTLGSRFGDWTVCWLGGWSRHRLYYLVMLVRLTPGGARSTRSNPAPKIQAHSFNEGKPSKKANQNAISCASMLTEGL
jgi:hypothetical protein